MNVNLVGYTKKSLSELPLTDFWGDLDKRWSQISTLLNPILERYENPKILDLAMGSGLDTLKLLDLGYKVVSNEIDPVGIADALQEAEKRRVPIQLRRVNWADFLNSSEYQENEFDILFSLGNSFPNYLFNEEEREKSLRGFWKVLKPGGTLIFDARNFDHMITDREQILKDPEHNFIYRYQSTYTGKNVKGFPVEISNERIHMLWKHYERKTYTEMDLWPATIANIKEMVGKAAPNAEMEIYFDYSKEKPEHYDVAQFVIRKPVS